MSLELLTPHDVAKLFGVHVDWIYDQCAAGKMPHVRLGRSIKFRPSDLEEYLDSVAVK